FTRLSNYKSILDEYVTNLNDPTIENQLLPEERFPNVHTNQTVGLLGQPYQILNPVLSPVPGSPTTPGAEMSLADYTEYYRWVNKNRSTLNPDQEEAVNANSSYFASDRFENHMDEIHTHLI